jgi:hypothetical protein
MNRLLAGSGAIAIVAIVTLAVSVLATGDHGDHDPREAGGASAMPPFQPARLTPSTTPVPPATPLPEVALQRLPITWSPVPDVLDLQSATEVAGPFGGSAGDWTLFVVGPHGPARLVYATPRWARSLDWKSRGPVATLWTQRAVESTIADGVVLAWEVETTIDPESETASDRFDRLPLACHPCTAASGLGSVGGGAGAGVHVYRNDPASHVLAVLYYDNGLNDPQKPPFLIDSVHIVDADGSSRRLEGLADVWGISWFPNGKALLGAGGVIVGDHPDAYFIPAGDGEALFLPKSLGTAVEGTGAGPGEPAGSRVAFAYSDAEKGTANYLGVFDTMDWKARSLGPAPPAYRRSSSSPPSIALYWPPGSNRFLAGSEEDAVLVDPHTGGREPGSLGDLLTPPRIESESPGGRYTARYDDLVEGLLPPECEGLPQGLRVFDRQTGRSKTLLECEGGSSGRVYWVNETTLVAAVYPFKFGDLDAQTLTLVNVTTGESRPLTDTPEDRVHVVPSPDGTKILVAGATLRVFDVDGNHLQDYGSPPEGSAFMLFAWSPDSASFAYMVGPRAFLPNP